jgi:hypothetical protein
MPIHKQHTTLLTFTTDTAIFYIAEINRNIEWREMKTLLLTIDCVINIAYFWLASSITSTNNTLRN